MSETLLQQIEQAFDDVEYPGDDLLTDSTYGDEPEALKREFKDKNNWQTLDAKFLDQAPEGWSSALFFFSDQALLFYLPAYLLADIRGELSIVTPETRLTSFLTVPGAKTKIAKQWGGGTMEKRVRKGFALFTQQQVSATVTYLQWKLTQYSFEDMFIQPALDNYWLPREKELSST